MAKTWNGPVLNGAAAWLAAVLMFLAATAAADEAAVRRLINSKLGGSNSVASVQKAPFGDLYEVAIRTAEGPLIYYVDSGATVIISGVFSDPNCPFCKRFEVTLDKIDDVTVHIFLYPVIKPESVPLTKSVWCSKDRSKAWNDLMLRGIRPSASPDCNTPVEKLVALGRQLGATSTPTWFLANGERYKGALPLEQVRRLLDEASPRP
ncbi:MAG: DsbC family protein [Betaproteobacteria bacterium]|nr:DsbC family protein [Betaproteobacteria bacterium]